MDNNVKALVAEEVQIGDQLVIHGETWIVRATHARDGVVWFETYGEWYDEVFTRPLRGLVHVVTA